MNILITGATGFIGRSTVAYLQGNHHTITAYTRDVEKAKGILGHDVKLLQYGASSDEMESHISSSDIIINLAGTPIANARWSRKKKLSLWDSRVNTTKFIADQIKKSSNPPRVFISASAIGYYGDRGDSNLPESTGQGDGFLAGLCDAWEKAALTASSPSTRVCVLRLGVVLGREGGILSRLSPIFQCGLGLYPGNGAQFMSWIHIWDVVRIIKFCMEDDNIQGPINCVSPEQVTAKGFTKEMNRVTKCKTTSSIPRPLLTLLLGEAATVLTASQKVEPTKLMSSGFTFKHVDLAAALSAEYNTSEVSIRKYRVNDSLFRNPPAYVMKSGQYQIQTKQTLNANIDEVFAFFGSPLNLGLTTPPWMNFKIVDMPKTIKEGDEITYKIRALIFDFKWVAKIASWQPQNGLFIDRQKKGPYNMWWHEHHVADYKTTYSTMTDFVIYRMPFGFLGKIAHFLMVKHILTRIFKYRLWIMELRYGSDE